MQTEGNFYIFDVGCIQVERDPKRGLIRVKIKGDSNNNLSLSCWGRPGFQGGVFAVQLPRVTITTNEEEPADASDVAVNAND